MIGVAPDKVLFERNVFPSRPSMMRMTYSDDKGKKKLHKSFSDLLDWLHAQQPLNFYKEMTTNCMAYLKPSDLNLASASPGNSIPTIGSSVSSPHGEAAAALLGSDSDDSDEDIVEDDASDSD